MGMTRIRHCLIGTRQGLKRPDRKGRAGPHVPAEICIQIGMPLDADSPSFATDRTHLCDRIPPGLPIRKWLLMSPACGSLIDRTYQASIVILSVTDAVAFGCL